MYSTGLALLPSRNSPFNPLFTTVKQNFHSLFLRSLVNFFTCHKISQVDLVYWSRRVEELREIYRHREKYLNPISGTQSRPSSEEIDQKIEARLKDFIQSQELKEAFLKMLKENGNETYESKIVTTEEERFSFQTKDMIAKS